MTTHERAVELWKKLPIIQEDYIAVIEEAFKEERADAIIKVRKVKVYEAGQVYCHRCCPYKSDNTDCLGDPCVDRMRFEEELERYDKAN